jgi:hypothetical protein
MPNINSIPEVLYQPNQPYHHFYDNLPLRNILQRIGLVNIQVDIDADILRGASGSAGNLNNRLNASMEESGNLKSSALDEAKHGIAYHVDGPDQNGVEYVRMKKEERSKLNLVADEANRFLVEIEDAYPTIGDLVTIPSENTDTLKLKNSSTIFFDFTAPNVLKAHTIFPPDAVHRHHYNLTPAYDVPNNPSFKNYRTTSLNTSYEPGTLRVYVNGFKLTNSPIKVLDYSSETLLWTDTYILSENSNNGEFELNRSLTINDVIRIDFDEIFIPPSNYAHSTPVPAETMAPTETPGETMNSTPTPTPTEMA